MSAFRQKHPFITGLLILAGVFLLFWGLVSMAVVSFFPRSAKKELFAGKEGIGIVELKGVIMASEKVVEALAEFRNDEDIKAIVLRIDCPGGAVGASQEIFEEVRRTNTQKPVIASMASLGASGAYYAALGAEKIFANPGTLTGSIGVIIKFVNLEELFEKIGYKNQVIKSGKLKDIGSADRPMTAEERKLMQALIDNVHGQFIEAVATSRSLPVDDVRGLADGRLFTGQQAFENGLVDSLGSFSDAVRLAAELGGLDPDNARLVYPQEEGFSLAGLLSAEGDLSLLAIFRERLPLLSYEWTGY